MPLNERLLRTIVAKQAERVLVRQVRPLVKLDFESKKKQFFREFDADSVTEEISGGPEAYSQIGEVAAAGGNLFSLLGFYAEQKPIDVLREYLHDNIVLYKTGAGKVVGDRVIFETEVIAPTESEVNSAMAANPDSQVGDEWTGRAFTDLLARGVTGLPNYLFDLTRDFTHIPSRSGPAVQTKGKQIRDANVRPIPYIERLLGVLGRIISPRK